MKFAFVSLLFRNDLIFVGVLSSTLLPGSEVLSAVLSYSNNNNSVA